MSTVCQVGLSETECPAVATPRFILKSSLLYSFRSVIIEQLAFYRYRNGVNLNELYKPSCWRMNKPKVARQFISEERVRRRQTIELRYQLPSHIQFEETSEYSSNSHQRIPQLTISKYQALHARHLPLRNALNPQSIIHHDPSIPHRCHNKVQPLLAQIQSRAHISLITTTECATDDEDFSGTITKGKRREGNIGLEVQ